MTFSVGQFTVQLINESKQSLGTLSSWDKAVLNESETIDVIIRIKDGALACLDSLHAGWSVVNSGENGIWTYSDGKRVLFGVQLSIPERSVIVFVNDTTLNSVRLGVQFGLLFALHKECLGLHGVTLLCGREIIVLSAPSGTGKTTLAHLLEKYCDAIVINGDFALLHPTEDGVIFEPTPFCGSSGRCLNHRFRINRVVFLGQAADNNWRSLDSRSAIKQFMNNCFIPTLDQAMRESVQTNILKCVEALQVNAYDFAPTKEAAENFLSRITQLKIT